MPPWLKVISLSVYLLAIGLGPPVFLIWTWQRWHSWKRLILHLVLLPVGVFVVGGSVGALATLVQCVVGPAPGPKGYGSGWSLIEYVWFTFVVVGVYSVMIAGALAIIWVPAVIGWRMLLPASFRWVTKKSPRVAESTEQLDYQELPVAQPNVLSGSTQPVESSQTDNENSKP